MADEKKPMWRIYTFGGGGVPFKWDAIALFDYDIPNGTPYDQTNPLLMMRPNDLFGRRELMEYMKVIRDALNTKDMLE